MSKLLNYRLHYLAIPYPKKAKPKSKKFKQTLQIIKETGAFDE